MGAYETVVKVRFGDIDHAGIVFYPRISEYFHVTFEEFFADRVRLPYHELFDIRRLGLPTVRTEIDYRESLRFGDVARVEFGVLGLGRCSVTTRYRIRKKPAGPVCVDARVTVVCVDMETFRPVPVPDDLREVFLAHRVEDRDE
ncbi:MAG: acyl-CoA thioesterase [Planctomycetes bacterium]|jgi:4-hydroxybenzoyl-CoA thioesterase|nr:acyl-CoA thioesterase [Planctomycetota bacterium]